MPLAQTVPIPDADLAGAKRLALQLVERLAVPAFVLDDQCRVLVWNPACERLTGIKASEVVGTSDHWRGFYAEPRPCLADLVIENRMEQSTSLYEVRHKTDQGGGLFAENWCVMPRLGKQLYLAIDASPVLDDAGRVVAAIETLRDITEHKKAEAEIEHLAAHDGLTGLANRVAFARHLAALAGRCASYALLLLDLDRFKEANDALGHAAGDAILMGCAAVFERVCPDVFAARIGGDEFVVIIEGATDREEVRALAEKMLTHGEAGVSFDGTRIAVSFSIGVAMVPGDARDTTLASRYADQALYLAKSEGGGVCRFFEPTLAAKASSRRAAVVDLRKAIEQQEFVLHYQPITKLRGEVIGFEALLRWNHPTRGLVPPAEFIPVAEQSELIGPIGEWVLRQACRDAAAWERPLQIAVNLSPIQFRLGDIANTVHAILIETGLSSARLELELTETAMIDSPSRTLAALRRLKALGVRIAMDDFGTGYSSLGYLQAFPFDKIKLDRSFTARLGQSTQSDAITRAVISLGHTLSLQILAEGVETMLQRDFLEAECCDLLQGYLFGRPAPIHTFTEWTMHEAPERLSRAG